MGTRRRVLLLMAVFALALAAMLAGPAVAMAQEIQVDVTPSEFDVVGSAEVVYTYQVSNITTSTIITDVSLTDDTFSPTYASGDDGDDILDPGEVWVYAATATITQTTTNEATVTGLLDGDEPVSDTDEATVIVTAAAEPEPEPEPEPEAAPEGEPAAGETVDGGAIPATATPWYNFLLIGAALALVGAAGLVTVSARSHA